MFALLNPWYYNPLHWAVALAIVTQQSACPCRVHATRASARTYVRTCLVHLLYSSFRTPTVLVYNAKELSILHHFGLPFTVVVQLNPTAITVTLDRGKEWQKVTVHW